MPDHTSLIERYIACWNASDTDRDALVAETFTEDVRYVDPLMSGSGHAGLAALMRGVRAQFPGFRFALTRAVDTVGDHVRFSWQLGPAESPAVIEGTDFARIAPDGRLAAIHGFLDRVPEAADA
ncbi:MAG TPA: nuclear transport factor 2 family protein [Gemmatimonadaceae bacterium]